MKQWHEPCPNFTQVDLDLRQIGEFKGIKEVKEVGGCYELDWLRSRGLMVPGFHFVDRLVSGTALAAGSVGGIDAQNRWLAPRRSHTDCHLPQAAQLTWTLKEFKEFKEAASAARECRGVS